MTWELEHCAETNAKYCARLLESGWQPFAVSEGVIWFRRQKSGAPPK